MNLYEQQPYWLMKNGLVTDYPSLDRDTRADIVIMGAGISAALIAWYLKDTGLDILVLDRRHVGMGSTAASTAFLQYEIDTPLYRLSNMVGETQAVRCYELCRKAIYDIEQICKSLKHKVDFHLVPSLQYASFKSHVAALLEEYEFRLKHGFNISWLESKDMKRKFGFDAPAAIFSSDGGEVDAYLLTHALLRDCCEKGNRVYNNTAVQHIENHQNGLTLYTDKGLRVQAKKLVIACGYESLHYIPEKIAAIHTTYALVSEPLPDTDFWPQKSLVWETATPYLYFRSVNGNRILIGGRDDPYHHPHIPPSSIRYKAKQLAAAFCKKIPQISLKVDFSWAGAFAVTRDGLPYVGSIPGRPNIYFALGFGGNGVTFSVIAAQILYDLLQEKRNSAAGLFSFNR